MSAIRDKSGLWWLPVALAVIGLDQWTKALVVRYIGFQDAVRVLPMLDLTLTYNSGAAFSMLARESGWQRWLFTLLALVVAVLIALYLRQLEARRQGLLCLALSLIMGGALGNMIDRLRIGHVVDFVAVHWHGAYFPAFNMADSAITVGAVLLFIDVWRGRGAAAG